MRLRWPWQRLIVDKTLPPPMTEAERAEWLPTIADWQEAVAHESTHMGLAEWQRHRLAAAALRAAHRLLDAAKALEVKP